MLLSIPPRPHARARLIPGLSLRAGDVLAGRFRVLSLLRADRICVHLAAIRTTSNKRVEIQILLAMDDGIEAVHLRFMADARKAAGLEDPHVDRVVHVGVTPDGNPFVVREPSSGSTIAELIAGRGAFATEHAVDIATAVCAAIESAHACGLVHGAIDTTTVRARWNAEAPTNVKVCSLGTSCALGMLSLDAHALASLTSRAPELLSSEREIDARSDVWGIGVLLYTMLAGEPPFVSESPSNVNLDVVLDEPPMLAGVPDDLAELVDLCLAKDPAKRPQSAAELAEKLAPFGANPVVVKRSVQPAVDTGPYDLAELERLVGEAGASKNVPTLQETKTPVVALTPSAPPVALSLSLAPAAEAPRSPWLVKALVAAACLATVAAGTALSMRTSTTEPVAASEPPPAAATAEPAPLSIVFTASPIAPSTPTTTPPVAAPKPASVAPAKPRPAAPAALPAPTVDPLVRSAAAPIQPQSQPKAEGDDLRHFLDDRR